MSEENGGATDFQFGNVLIEPVESGGRYSCLVSFVPLTGIQPNDLPATMSKRVVDLFGKDPLISRPIRG